MPLSSTNIAWEVAQVVVHRVRRSNEYRSRGAHREIMKKNASFDAHTEIQMLGSSEHRLIGTPKRIFRRTQGERREGGRSRGRGGGARCMD